MLLKLRKRVGKILEVLRMTLIIDGKIIELWRKNFKGFGHSEANIPNDQ